MYFSAFKIQGFVMKFRWEHLQENILITVPVVYIVLT